MRIPNQWNFPRGRNFLKTVLLSMFFCVYCVGHVDSNKAFLLFMSGNSLALYSTLCSLLPQQTRLHVVDSLFAYNYLVSRATTTTSMQLHGMSVTQVSLSRWSEANPVGQFPTSRRQTGIRLLLGHGNELDFCDLGLSFISWRNEWKLESQLCNI